MPSAAVPDILVSVFRAYTEGRLAEAREIYNRVLPLLNLEMSVQMAVSKEVLRRRKVFTSTRMRDPEFPALDSGDLKELDAIWPNIEPLFAAGDANVVFRH